MLQKLITGVERTNQRTRNAIFKVENLIISVIVVHNLTVSDVTVKDLLEKLQEIKVSLWVSMPLSHETTFDLA